MIADLEVVRPGLDEFLPLIDCLIAAAEFPRRATGCRDLDESTRLLEERSAGALVIVTQGARGAVQAVHEEPVTCRYLVFIHTAVGKLVEPDEDGITRPSRGRIILGDKVADYQIMYEDGSEKSVAIRRRFAIGEMSKAWGDECFEAVPLAKSIALPTITERTSAGEPPDGAFGHSQTRVGSDPVGHQVPGNYWVYALENQKPDQALTGIKFTPADSTILIMVLLPPIWKRIRSAGDEDRRH